MGWGEEGKRELPKRIGGRGAANDCCNAGAEEGERRKEDQFFPLLPTPMQLLPNVSPSSSSSCKQGKEGLLNTTTPTPPSQFLPSPFSSPSAPALQKEKGRGWKRGVVVAFDSFFPEYPPLPLLPLGSGGGGTSSSSVARGLSEGILEFCAEEIEGK